MAKKKELPRNKDGQKLYPVCNWERNQHKLYDIRNIAKMTAEETNNETDHEELERIDKLIASFNECVVDGTSYMTWEDGLAVKDILTAYSVRKNDKMVEEIMKCDVPHELGWEEFEDEPFEAEEK